MNKFLDSFRYAFNGIAVFFGKDRNGQIELVCTIAAIIMSIVFKISETEWLFVIACCGAMIALELLNSSIEKLCDLVHPEPHPQVKIIKDFAAGAVVIMGFASLAIGLVIFIPKIF